MLVIVKMREMKCQDYVQHKQSELAERKKK